MTDHDNGIGKPIDRRCLMKLLALTGASAAVPTGFDALAQGTGPAFEVENPKYLALYDKVSGYYFNDQQWVKETTPRLTWPAAGDKVPEIRVIVPTNEPHWLEGM